MLWKPVTPVYPRLVQRVPEGLTLEEATEMRKRGRQLTPICKLGNHFFIHLLQFVHFSSYCGLVSGMMVSLSFSVFKHLLPECPMPCRFLIF